MYTTKTNSYVKNTTIPRFELGVFDDVVGSHPVKNELCLVGHPHDVVLHGVRQEPPLVYLQSKEQPVSHCQVNDHLGTVDRSVDSTTRRHGFESSHGPNLLLTFIVKIIEEFIHFRRTFDEHWTRVFNFKDFLGRNNLACCPKKLSWTNIVNHLKNWAIFNRSEWPLILDQE